ncbi:PTS cellobiose transporter subunit IIB [Aerococcus viridans]|uniref:PTS cellobiose transporter subunit IIB n=1 Tax=Aerococcus TaxID=1375 RepID=UPI0025C09367|nr:MULTISPECIES: PTS cellobiose transporter subunit IIB [unclassified Aerococcus]GMR69542.1 PTS cellobiose transporter subunit IIB [Aerococcus viridans]
MKKVLIVCAGGMSSSLVAKEVTTLFQTHGTDIAVTATSIYAGQKAIEEDQFDLYLVSSQTRMYFDNLVKFAHRMAKPIVKIPPQTYVPLPKQTQMLADLIAENI